MATIDATKYIGIITEVKFFWNWSKIIDFKPNKKCINRNWINGNHFKLWLYCRLFSNQIAKNVKKIFSFEMLLNSKNDLRKCDIRFGIGWICFFVNSQIKSSTIVIGTEQYLVPTEFKKNTFFVIVMRCLHYTHFFKFPWRMRKHYI